MLAALAADAGVRELLGEPLRVIGLASPAPAYPYLEIARHLVSPAGTAGVAASEHRVDLVVVSQFDGRARGRSAIAAMRSALEAAELAMEGWRCVLLLPAFADTLSGERGIRRSLLRMRAVVEAV